MISSVLIYSINIFVNLLTYALIARAILSWAAQSSPNMYQLYNLSVKFTEPIVYPFRMLLSRFNTGMFDFSVLVAMIAIRLIGRLAVILVVVLL